MAHPVGGTPGNIRSKLSFSFVLGVVFSSDVKVLCSFATDSPIVVFVVILLGTPCDVDAVPFRHWSGIITIIT